MEHSNTNIEPLPEYWPPDTQLPTQPVWLPWPVAVVLAPLLWLLPKRMGPHFTQSRWTGAIIAHICWTTYGIGCIVNAYVGKYYSWIAYLTGQTPGGSDGDSWMAPSFSQLFRTPLAAIINGIFEINSNLILYNNITVDSSVLIWSIFSVIVGTTLFILLLSFLLMPFITAGERWRYLFARSVKLTLWATTSLMVLGFAIQAIELFVNHRHHRELYTVMAVSVYIAFFLWIWIRSGIRYAGPAEGHGFQPRRPLCEQCGYILTGLSATDHCPECGRAVIESFAIIRSPTAFAEARNFVTRIPAFLNTFGNALAGYRFYRNLQIYNAHHAARRFAIWVYIVTGPLFFFGYAIYSVLLSPFQLISFKNQLEISSAFVVVWIFVIVALLVLSSFLVLCISLFGYLPIKPRATIVFYFSPWLVLFALSIPLTVCLYIYWTQTDHFHNWFEIWNDAWYLGKIDWAFFFQVLHQLSPSLPTVLILLIGAIRLRQVLHQTKFANG